MGMSLEAPTVNIATVPKSISSGSPSELQNLPPRNSKDYVLIVSSMGDTPERILIAATPEDRRAKGSDEGMVFVVWMLQFP